MKKTSRPAAVRTTAEKSPFTSEGRQPVADGLDGFMVVQGFRIPHKAAKDARKRRGNPVPE